MGGVLLLALTARGVVAQGPRPISSAALNTRVDSVVPSVMARYHLPGAVVAVVRHDSVLALRGFGFARLEDSTRADPERSIYRIASVAKLFVASIVLGEVDRGRLELDRDILTWAPELAGPATRPPAITLRQLLTHTAGFDERVIGYGAKSVDSMRPLGEYLASRLPDRGWPPGALISYSNHGMGLAAYVAERASGTRFAELTRRNLFQPAHMTRSFYVAPPDDSLARDMATGYRCGSGGCMPAPVVWSHVYPVGLAFSTAADMARFMRLQLAGGRLDGVQVVPSPAVAAMQHRQFTHHPALPGIGFAFFERERRGVGLLTHAGGVPGVATVLALAPEAGVGVYVATNAGEPGFTREVLESLLDALLPAAAPSRVQSLGSVAEYAGAYRLARISHRTIERFPGAFAFALAARARGDTLLLPLGSQVRKFVRVDSLLLHEVEGDLKVVLRRSGRGRITHLFTGVPSGGAELPGAFERVPWYEGAYFLNEYVSWLLGLPVIVFAIWGIVSGLTSTVRRLKRAPRAPAADETRNRALAIVLVIAVVAAFALFGFGFVARSVRQLGGAGEMTVGISGLNLLLLRLAWPLAVAGVPVLWLAVHAWRRRWWSLFGRLCYSVLAVCALGISHFVIWWGYVPGSW